MLVLEYKHRSQPHCSLPTSTHIHSVLSHLRHELIPHFCRLAIERKERARVFSSEVLDVGVACGGGGGEGGEGVVEVGAYGGGLGD